MRVILLALALLLAACGSSAALDAGPQPPGNTDADCGNDHRACNPGQSCGKFGSGQNVHLSCGCARPTPSSPDSCAANTNGEVVCEPFTLDCRRPRDEEPCLQTADCDTGYTCANAIGNTYADGGQVRHCIFRCAMPADCPLVTTTCIEAFFEALPDGGTQVSGDCHSNFCGPHAPLQDGGMANLGAFYSACPAAAASDGICLPAQRLDGTVIGLCHRMGTAHPGSVCHNNSSDGESCSLGNECVTFDDPAAPSKCEVPCDASPSGSIARCPASQTCAAFTNDFAQTHPQPGSCH